MSLLDFAEYIGIIAFALSGFWVGIEEKLDLLGIFIVSFLTALGGGIIRDVIVNLMPYSFMHYFPTILVILVICSAILFKLHKNLEFQKRKIFIISDSIGLVSFSITGAMVGLQSGLNFFGVIFLSLITAVGGGILRDIMLNRLPMILKEQIYATISLLLGALIFMIDKFYGLNFFIITILFLFGLTLRLVAYFRDWHLPRI